VRALHSALKIRGVDDLRRALAAGRLTGVRGFGPRLRAQLQTALEAQQIREARWRWRAADEQATALCAHLRAQPRVIQVLVAGSLRRCRDTVGDLDLVVVALAGFGLARALRDHPRLQELTASSATRCSGVLTGGMRFDVRAVPPHSLGAAMLYFTGSRAHNLHLRRRAKDRGLKLNEYGLFRGAKAVAGATEEEVYTALKLPWIPPELREDRGELEAAAVSIAGARDSRRSSRRPARHLPPAMALNRWNR
jgi:DNA polymerase (family 10)